LDGRRRLGFGRLEEQILALGRHTIDVGKILSFDLCIEVMKLNSLFKVDIASNFESLYTFHNSLWRQCHGEASWYLSHT
jgi:hypothetical protein